ncbi:MAG: hypothetical protein Q4C04_01380 [Clostridia bacterium]|nr:hypothetical protein [Clostridia bacterium]
MHSETTFFSAAIPLLYMLCFALCGLSVSEYVFFGQKFARRLWLGLALGLFAFTWFPSLFAFFIGFTLLAQILGLLLALALGFTALMLSRRLSPRSFFIKRDVKPLIILIGIFAIGCVLFSTHILKSKDGAYYVGQTTYGDLSMHLGFITSIAEQGTFPPDYSIFSGYPMSYPFMCETSSSSLLLLGANLRFAYLLPALWAYALVILGAYNFFEGWLKRKGRTVFATLLFFFGGGFGFLYFLDLINASPTALSSLLGTGANNLQTLLDGFYQTPTNIPALGLRWVNPIVDMLIPQRATLFGWAFLFPCLYLLCDFVRTKRRRNLVPLGIIAGGMPLIHTHSFVALAIISAAYFLYDLFKTRDKKLVLDWLVYAAIAVVLALPQLVLFTFKQTSEGNMLRIGLNWANGTDSFLWFYIKNLGFIFLLAPIAFFTLSGDDRKLYGGALLLWLVAEVVLFQPNEYDNNKLLFIWFLFTCGLVAKFLAFARHKLLAAWQKKHAPEDALRVRGALCALCLSLLTAYLIIKAIIVQSSEYVLGYGTLATILFVLGFVLSQQFCAAIVEIKKGAVSSFLPRLLSAAFSSALVIILLRRLSAYYGSGLNGVNVSAPLLTMLACLALAAQILSAFTSDARLPSLPFKNPWALGAVSLTTYLLCVSLFLSGAMTIAREYKSEYMAFNNSEIEAATFILENTDADAVFLTDYSWHLNPVSALSGRSIVCGTDTFLYFHGIDTTERKEDIASMFSYPSLSQDLFEKYGVDYVYIGSSERSSSNYNCDSDYFSSNYAEVYNSGGIAIYDLNRPL